MRGFPAHAGMDLGAGLVLVDGVTGLAVSMAGTRAAAPPGSFVRSVRIPLLPGAGG